MYGAHPAPRAAGTAKILIIVGIALQALEVAVLVLLIFGVLIIPIIGVAFLVFAVIGVLWLVLVFTFSYSRVANGDYSGARAPTLVFAILSLLTLSLISGVLYLVAYAELGTAEREMAMPYYGGYGGAAPGWGAAPGTPLPPPTMAPPQKFCGYCGRPNPTTSRFCQGCGAQFAT